MRRIRHVLFVRSVLKKEIILDIESNLKGMLQDAVIVVTRRLGILITFALTIRANIILSLKKYWTKFLRLLENPQLKY